MRRKILAVSALVMASMLLVDGPATMTEAEATPTAERHLLKMTNQARRQYGRPTLRMHGPTRRKARLHSRRMASRGTIYHSSCLRCMAPAGGWRIVGENVAKATTLKAAHRALMRSRPHRGNILQRRFRRAGMGVIKRGRYFYITQVFYG